MSRRKKIKGVSFKETLRMLAVSLIVYLSFIAIVTFVVIYLATEFSKAMGWL